MDNHNDESMAENSSACAHEFSPAGMVSFLLGSGYTVDDIEGRVAAPSGFVHDCLSKAESLPDIISNEIARLKEFYLREQVNAILRATPFIGIEKGAVFLGIGKDDYKRVYEALIRSGEVKFTREIPTWGDDSLRKIPLRKHIVK